MVPFRLGRLYALLLLSACVPALAQELRWTSWGAARTVSGSMHLLEWADSRILLDSGSYFSDEAAAVPEDGKADDLNISLPIEAKDIDFVILSHAHLDHSGRIPLLVRQGFRGQIYATPGTIMIARHMLSMTFRYGPLPEEIFYYQRGKSVFHSRQHCPKLEGSRALIKVRGTRQALDAKGYRMCDACADEELERVMLHFVPLHYGQWQELLPGLRLRFSDAGHIVGAASSELEFNGKRRIVFSGDLGGQVELLVKPPLSPERADTAIVESTYGGSVRQIPLPPYADFEEALGNAARKNEPVVVISYTLDRTQRVLYLLRRAQTKGLVPEDWPVIMPSPSARGATEIYDRLLSVFGAEYFAPSLVRFAGESGRAFEPKGLLYKDTEGVRGLFIVPAGLEFSKTGQRILSRLLRLPSAHVFSVGYSDPDSITGQILAGKEPTIEGVHVPLNAEVRKFSVFSGHADSEEMMGWLKGIAGLKRVIVVHGEPQNNDALAQKIRERLGIEVIVAEKGKAIPLGDTR